MNLYRQSIILFGFVVPVLLAAAVLGIGYFVKSNVSSSFTHKQSNFIANEQTQKAGMQIEKDVINLRGHLDRWKDQLSQETASSVATNLREISEKLPNKEIQQTVFERATGKAGFGSASAQNSAQLRIGFRGTFRTLQKAFFELETRIPQLQLQEMKIEPISTSAAFINLQIGYTAWEK